MVAFVSPGGKDAMGSTECHSQRHGPLANDLHVALEPKLFPYLAVALASKRNFASYLFGSSMNIPNRTRPSAR